MNSQGAEDTWNTDIGGSWDTEENWESVELDQGQSTGQMHELCDAEGAGLR